MNTILMNTISLDDGKVIVKGGGNSGGGGGDTPSGGGASAGAVNFRDYDGTILHSYSKDEFLALSELPALPTQKGLICQGWNYNLDDAKAYVSEYGILEVGATYITDDGKTRLYISVPNGRQDVPLYFNQSVDNGVTIDWGDGSATQTLSGTENVNTRHHYNNIGDYVISLDVADGCTLVLGHIGSYTSIMGLAEYSNIVYCNMLQKIEIGKGITTIESSFDDCSSLSSVVIPHGVTSIGAHAFFSCDRLASVVIPHGVTYIGDEAFRGCSALSCIEIPQGVTSIGYCAFGYCDTLTSVVIPQGVTDIVSSVFNNCYSLSSVVIPQGVTIIDEMAFSHCYSLTSVVIPQGVTEIGGGAFSNCRSLTSVVIPDSVTYIGEEAFRECGALLSIRIPQGVTSIGYNTFAVCSCLSSVVIPQGVTNIEDGAFSHCYSLTSVVIPQGVTEIGGYAFSSCYSLTSVVIPQGVTGIYSTTFRDCYSLASIVIPESVTYIGSQAFENCYGMAFYDFSALKAVPSLESDAFWGMPSDCKILVPFNLYDEWITATNWSDLAASIVLSYTPTECTSLTISADDVSCRATSTTIRYEAITNGVDLNGNILNNIVLKGTSKSEEFPINTSDEEVLRTVSFTYLGKTATTTIKQGKYVPASYSVDLNNEWRLSDEENPDASLYEGVYESYSNHNVDGGVATMYLDISGYTEFTMYIKSNGEEGCDYIMVSQPDKDINENSGIYNTDIVKDYMDNPSWGTDITAYKEVKYDNLDGGDHRITILYRKDGSVNEGEDRGYILIKKP